MSALAARHQKGGNRRRGVGRNCKGMVEWRTGHPNGSGDVRGPAQELVSAGEGSIIRDTSVCRPGPSIAPVTGSIWLKRGFSRITHSPTTTSPNPQERPGQQAGVRFRRRSDSGRLRRHQGYLSEKGRFPNGSPGGLHQLQLQAVGVVATLVYSGAASWVLLKIIDIVMDLRVGPEVEREGLDISLHGEQVL